MNAERTPLDDVLLIHPDRFQDERGWFVELSNEERYAAVGLDQRFVQTNVSRSSKGVLRGMHYQWPHPQGKLVSVLEGAVFDAVVDIRRGSPTFGRWYGCELSAENGIQLWVPQGFAHGFLVLSEVALVHYSCTEAYRPEADRVLVWDDPEVGIEWPFSPFVISDKDAAASRLVDIPDAALPHPSAAPEPTRS
jgi:dTDP-4-dehydrorhamnose 3,5-epimerase